MSCCERPGRTLLILAGREVYVQIWILGGQGGGLSSADHGCCGCLSALVSGAGSLSKSGLCLPGLW